MLQTTRAYRGMVTAPHHLAARAGLRVLEDGGDAIEAMIAAAAAITVVYPHMNAIGGDNFWLIHSPGKGAVGIDACGGAAMATNIDYFGSRGINSIPTRGALSALTVAGAVSGWQTALDFSRSQWDGNLSLERLLEDAIFWANDGVAVSETLAKNAELKYSELRSVPGFAGAYLSDGLLPKPGQRLRQPRLAKTLDRLAKDGLDGFYRGALADDIVLDLANVGSPLRSEDFAAYRASCVEPLSVDVAGHQVFNLPPPTQGVASLMVLGIYERLGIAEAETFDYVHGLVEATKRAFLVRDRYVTDPDYMVADPHQFLTSEALDANAAVIDRERALPWPHQAKLGDTVWLGAVDHKGRAVSFIQSVYWEFGSGIVLDRTGITWQNRGTSFSLDPAHHNCLMPRRRPFHTIQPAMALLSDGRVMVYGTMGGEGQPQTQAMIFTRHVLHDQDLQLAVTAPRWLLGRTWGAETTNLRIEGRMPANVISALSNAGHDVDVIADFDDVTGHAGALVLHADGLIEGAADPRGDGQAAGF
ncbi:MAG: gamma-glutamyltransferase family protein [Hyphomicrobiaceae bacterium]